MQLGTEFSDMEPHEFAMVMIDRIEKQWGINISAQLLSRSADPQIDVEHAQRELAAAIHARAVEQGYWEDWVEEPSEDVALRAMYVPGEAPFAGARSIETRSATSPGTTYPSFGITLHNRDVIMSYRNAQVKEYLYNLTNGFQLLTAQTSPGAIAATLVSTGVASVGASAGWGVIKALRAGKTLMQAVRAGVLSVGVATVVFVVAAVLLELVLFLLAQKKQVLGMVINNTKEDLVVDNWRNGMAYQKPSDLYIHHGKMSNFMMDRTTAALDSPQVQIKGMLEWGDDMARAVVPDADEDLVFAGLYFAEKRDFAAYGVETTMIFQGTKTKRRFAHSSCCPFSASNGCNMAFVPADARADALHANLYNSRTTYAETRDSSFKLQAAMDSSSGGVSACIAVITQL